MVATSSSLLKWLNIVAFIVVVIVNGLAGSTTVIGGKNTAQISDANPTLITPAGYVFSIWGIIYILLGIFVFYQALRNQKAKEFRTKVGYLFIASSILNIVWLFLWQFECLVFSVVVMFLLLTTLIAIYLRLEVGKSAVSLREKIAFHLPFSVYLGWITIASIANVATTLVSVNWDGFGISPETWALLIVIIALIITLLTIATRQDLAYGLVIIWALLGITMKQSGNQVIVIATEVSTIIILSALALSILISKNKTIKTTQYVIFMNDYKAKTILYFELIGIIFIVLVGSALHFTFDLSGNNPLIGVFSAVNESVWEHLKLSFWPALLYAVIEYRYLNRAASYFFTAKAVGIYLMPLIIVSSFY